MLKQNVSIQAQSPYRFRGGALGTYRSFWGRTERVNFTIGEGMENGLAGWPYGHLAPSSWILPRKAGAISSHGELYIRLDASGTGVLGRNIDGTATISFDVTGTGSLISSATGTASLSLSAEGSIYATKAASGTASLSLGANGTLTALGWTGGSAGIVFGGAQTAYAIGWISGTTANTGTLTTDAIAQAVWSALAAGNNQTGTMGELLNSGGGGGGGGGATPSQIWSLSAALAAATPGSIGEHVLKKLLSTGNFIALKD